MANITREEAQRNRELISRLLGQGLSHDQCIEQLQIDRSTFYRYLKQIRDLESDIWAKVEIDSARYRGLALLRSFEDTVRICTTIAQSNNVSNKDRIEACKARDIANAHILRLVTEGTMFRHLPELKNYVNVNSIEDNNKELEYTESDQNDDDDSIGNVTDDEVQAE